MVMTSKYAGFKAIETKMAKYGPDELTRAGRQMAWTKANGNSADNPNLREKFYTAFDQDRWLRFDKWQSENPERSVWENFYRHPNAIQKNIEFVVVKNSNDHDAIDDLNTDGDSDRAKTLVDRYARDLNVRKKVMLRARGHCEYCGRLGFRDANDQAYLECHHIIALAKQGADRMSNVIALCPEHHREAHFGHRAEALEREMILKVELKEGST